MQSRTSNRKPFMPLWYIACRSYLRSKQFKVLLFKEDIISLWQCYMMEGIREKIGFVAYCTFCWPLYMAINEFSFADFDVKSARRAILLGWSEIAHLGCHSIHRVLSDMMRSLDIEPVSCNKDSALFAFKLGAILYSRNPELFD